MPFFRFCNPALLLVVLSCLLSQPSPAQGDEVPGWDAAPSEVLPDRDIGPATNPVYTPMYAGMSFLGEVGYFLQLQYGIGMIKSQMAKKYASEAFSAASLRSDFWRLRFAIIAENEKRSLKGYYIGLQDSSAKDARSYPHGQIAIRNVVSTLQMGYFQYWSPAAPWLIGGELDLGFGRERSQVSAQGKKVTHNLVAATYGAGLGVKYVVKERYIFNLTARIDTQLHSYGGGVAYAF